LYLQADSRSAYVINLHEIVHIVVQLI